MAAAEKLRDVLPSFAGHCLTIRTKTGSSERFQLNAAQWRVHAAIEAQRTRTGRVRALILKARQWGCSTYVEARAFHMTKYTKGARVFILTQAQDKDRLDFRHCTIVQG